MGRTGTGWDSLAEKMRANASAPWMDLVYKPKSLVALQAVWSNDFTFDPRPYAARMRQPVLALVGDSTSRHRSSRLQISRMR